MLTLPNFLSFLRIPLGLFFIFPDVTTRLIIITFALLSDILDGYLARRLHSASKLGTLLDPISDKFFAIAVFLILIGENQLHLWQALALLSRDFAVLAFGCYLVTMKKWNEFQVRAIWIGKITTFAQYLVLFALLCHKNVPDVVFQGFILLGIAAFAELYFYFNHKASV